MYDPLWDDAREREDGRGRVDDQPDREHDPRDYLRERNLDKRATGIETD